MYDNIDEENEGGQTHKKRIAMDFLQVSVKGGAPISRQVIASA